MLEQKGKGNTRKNNSTTWENKQESTGERITIKEISTKGKTIQTKQNIPKQWKKILPTIGRRRRENIATTRCKSNRTISENNMATKKKGTEKLNGQTIWLKD